MEKINYQRSLDEIIEQLEKTGRASSLLLHSCCGPCSSYILEYLAPYFRIELLFDNPNIQPREEYEKRLEEQKKIIQHIQAPHGLTLHEGIYDTKRYFQAVDGLTHLGEGSERCFACYQFRMESAAQLAVNLSCEYFATTLSISPYKNAAKINEIGEAIAKQFDVKHLPNDFKKRGGYQRSIVLCKEWDIYRQHYCGCIFSQREMEQKQAEQAQSEA